MTAPRPRAGVEIAPLDPGELRAAARVLGDAFIDDPVWAAIGPHHRGHRRYCNRVSFAGMLTASRRADARIRIARPTAPGQGAGGVAGVSVAFAPGAWPISDASLVWELGWALVAGPLPTLRGFRDDRAMRAAHVFHPHMYLWFLAVDPGLHGSGVGRALLADLHAASDRLAVPTFLETSTESNVAFYEGDGYVRGTELELPSGPRMWQLERPPGG